MTQFLFCGGEKTVRLDEIDYLFYKTNWSRVDASKHMHLRIN